MKEVVDGQVAELAGDCGFELAGVAPAEPLPETSYYLEWISRGMAGEMDYLADDRAGLRADPRRLLPSARSVICVGKLYNRPEPLSTEFNRRASGWISRYAWGQDYHRLLRRGLELLAGRLSETLRVSFEWKICVDTAPLMERACARRAGLGWIGNNTCLINQQQGSWFFLGELLTSLELEPDAPPPERCGTCTRCIDACPTGAIVATGLSDGPRWMVDSRRCISYLTIELRNAVPEEHRGRIGHNVFGCDICQDVCPWNRKAPVTQEPAFAPAHFAPPLERLAGLTPEQFRGLFRNTPVSRAKHRGFLRNVAIAMGNSRLSRFRRPLEKLAESPDALVAGHARWALGRLDADG